MIQSGKISTFGGKDDLGVSPSEGLAFIEPVDLSEWWFNRLFLVEQPHGTTGLARRLNPEAFYIAMPFSGITRSKVRRAIFRLSANGKTIFAQAADWGPNIRTQRIVDMSPGAAEALGLVTDDTVEVEMILA